jgi:hypothetical protein
MYRNWMNKAVQDVRDDASLLQEDMYLPSDESIS